MKLESGPAAYDRNYYLAFLVLCVALGIWFLYDYRVRYPNQNIEQARKTLAPILGADKIPDTFPQTPTGPMFNELKESKPTDPAAVRQALGEPLERRQTIDGETREYYVSAYGKGEVPIVNGRVDPARMEWTAWGKSKDEIKLQLYLGFVVFLVALFVLYRVYRAATLHALIDDEGMTYGGRRIPFDAMTRLCDYSRKGWVDLYYRLGREERKLRIDNQKIRKFDEIIDTLCEAKGFEDPRKAGEQSETAEPPAVEESTEPEGAAATPDDAPEESEPK